MFPALVNINPWLQEMVYGALSILAVTLLPGGVMSLLKAPPLLARAQTPEAETAAAEAEAEEPMRGEPLPRLSPPATAPANAEADVTDPDICGRMPQHRFQLSERAAAFYAT